jgi:two-component system, NtrC family, sensor kinase
MRFTFFSNSLARQSLLSMGLRLSVIIAATSAISYYHLMQNLKTRTTDNLAKYSSMRGQREQIVFSMAKNNHQVLSDEFLFRFKQLKDREASLRFERLTMSYPDGHIRNRKSGFGGPRDAGIFIQKDAVVTSELKKKILVAYDIVREFGPAFHPQFQDTYFTFPEKAIVIYWPESFQWVFDIKADYKVENEEWFQISLPGKTSSGKTAWTGTFFDSVAKTWMVTTATPMAIDGHHLVTAHHDVMLDEIFQRTINNKLEGTQNYLIRADGRLIAHPLQQKQIEEKNGLLFVSELDNQALQEQFRAIQASAIKDGVLDLDSETDGFLGVSHLLGPDWYLVTVYPKSLLRDSATTISGLTLFLGALSLILELIILFWVLRDRVTKPLHALMKAAQQLAQGKFSVSLDTQRLDELGDFARSFMTMKNVIQERDRVLERHNQNLESIVQKRTQELELARAHNIQASKMATLGEVAGGVAHEINTPLGIIQMRAEQLKDQIEKKRLNFAVLSECVESIEKTVQRISKIVKGLKSFSRDGSQAPFEPTPLRALVQETLDLASERFRFAGIAIEVVIDESLEAECRSVQISQVLLNLLNNAHDAIQHLPQKWIRLEAEIKPGSDMIHLSVTDSGNGIPDAIAEKLMQPFFTTKEVGQGTGLGLSISLGIAADHQGSLYLDRSCSNTRFVLTLPPRHKYPAKAA